MSIAQRQAWGETISQLAEVDERVIVLDGDLATSTRADIIAREHPESFIEIGIAEQNLVGMAAGLSTMGYRPWLSSFGVFLTHRALDQVRMLVSQMHSPIRLAASYAGLLNGSSGKTHQDLQDFAIMRAMPGMTVIAPADDAEARAATVWAAEHDGPVYLRLARDPVADIFSHGMAFDPDRIAQLRDGDAAVVVSTGVQSSRVAEATRTLAASGIDVAHLHIATLKPLDSAALLERLAGFDRVFTVEEHSRIGGMGGLVAETLAGARGAGRLTRIGLADRWSESAPNEFLLDKYGLSSSRVADCISRSLGGERVLAPHESHPASGSQA